MYQAQILTRNRKLIASTANDSLDYVAGWVAIALGYANSRRYTITVNADLSKYRLLSDVSVGSIQEYGDVPVDDYALWIDNRDKYNTVSLYGFNNTGFLQGIRDICLQLNEPPGQYIIRLPFDGQGNQYDISGLGLSARKMTIFGFDLDDVEEEQKDNEAMYAPFRNWGDDLNQVA